MERWSISALGSRRSPRRFARPPSGTGAQASIFGVLGLLAASEEGLEVNVLGLTFGLDPSDLALKLPLVGSIAAGGPILAEENIEDELGVPEPLGRNADFLLRVRGDSMINAGILDGDIVVIRRQDDARNGEIVAALMGDDESANEATVKRFFRDGTRVRLQPENDALDAMFPDYVQILGKVVGVFRSL